MRAVCAAVDAEFVLQKDHTHATDIQKVGRASVLGDVLFQNIKTNAAIVASERSRSFPRFGVLVGRFQTGDWLAADGGGPDGGEVIEGISLL